MKNILLTSAIVVFSLSCKTSSLDTGTTGLSSIEVKEIDKTYDNYTLEIINTKDNKQEVKGTFREGEIFKKSIPYGTYQFKMTYHKKDSSVLVSSDNCKTSTQNKNIVTLSKPKESVTVQVCYDNGDGAEHKDSSDVTITPELKTEGTGGQDGGNNHIGGGHDGGDEKDADVTVEPILHD